MKALVTGGGGFLGSYIVEALLERGDQVAVFARGDYSERFGGRAQLYRGDLADPGAIEAACADVEVVFHTAAIAGHAGDPRLFHSTNVEGTRSVIAACRRQGVKKLVFTSSPSAVIGVHDIRGADESIPYPRRFLNAYSQTKAEAEQLVLAANGQEGLETTALRPHAIYGPGDTHLVPRIIERARSGQLRIIGSGTNRISVCYVENAARGHLQAADSDRVGGKVYFINDAEPVVWWDWINNLLKGIGLPPVTSRLPFSVGLAVAVASEALAALRSPSYMPLLNRYALYVLSKDHYFDASRAAADFGYRDEVAPEEGVRRTLAFLRERVV